MSELSYTPADALELLAPDTEACPITGLPEYLFSGSQDVRDDEPDAVEPSEETDLVLELSPAPAPAEEEPRQPLQLKLLPPEPVRPEFLEVPLDLLPPNSQILGPAPCPDFVSAVRDFGVIEPIILTFNPEEYEQYVQDWSAYVDAQTQNPDTENPRPTFYYGLAAGGRRIKTARLLCKEITDPDLRARMSIHPMRAMRYTTDQWKLVQAWMLNQQRHENLPVALAALDLLYKQQASDSDVLAVIRCSAQTLKKLKKLRALRPELRQALADDKMKASVAEAAARLSDENQARLVVVLRETGRITQPDIDEILKGVRQEAVEEIEPTLFDSIEEEHDAEPAEPDAWRQPIREAALMLIELVQEIAHTPRRDVKSDHMTRWSEKGGRVLKMIEATLGESAKDFEIGVRDAFDGEDDEEGQEQAGEEPRDGLDDLASVTLA